MENKTPQRILLAVTGLTPQVVTETLFALACQGETPWVPDRIQLLTTATGAESARLNLLQGQAWFHRLVRDYGLPPIQFGEDDIQVLRDNEGRPLDDIRTPDENALAADFISDTLRRLTRDADSELHVSIAGGRKTMGYYLGYALSLFGRPQDRLSHVLVSDPYETNRDFYYPTPYSHPIHAQRGGKEYTVDARNGRVELAHIPFVRLRGGIPQPLIEGGARFSEVVAAAQCVRQPPALEIHIQDRKAIAGGQTIKLTGQNLTLLLWMARQRLAGNGPVRCTTKDEPNMEAARTYLAVCRETLGSLASETVKAEEALKRGMESGWLSPAKNRLHNALIRALGQQGASPYFIQNVGPRKAARFQLGLAPEHIKIHP